MWWTYCTLNTQYHIVSYRTDYSSSSPVTYILQCLNANELVLKLTLNIDRTNYILFKRINKTALKVSVIISGRIINQSKQLGLMADNKQS